MPALTMDDGFIFNNKKNLPPIVSTMQNSHQPLSSLLAFGTIAILCQHVLGLFLPHSPILSESISLVRINTALSISQAGIFQTHPPKPFADVI